MRIKQLIVIVITIGCFWLAHAGINKVCTSCVGCQTLHETSTAEKAATTAAVTNSAINNTTTTKVEPIIFYWNSPESLTSSSFTTYRDSIKNALQTDQQIEVFGYYFKEETTPDSYPNIGLARADALIEKLSETIPRERMQARAQVIPEVDGVRELPFISTSVRFVKAPPKPAISNDKKASPVKDVARVDQVGGRALIYFPFNSIQKINSQEIDDYLDKLAKRVIASGEHIYITGHTDDVGSEVSNIGIGRGRARAIRDILQNKSVPKKQITIDSKGKSEPTAPNDSDANRALNRRVEVEVQ